MEKIKHDNELFTYHAVEASTLLTPVLFAFKRT